MWWFSFFKFIKGLNPSSELQKLNLEIGFIAPFCTIFWTFWFINVDSSWLIKTGRGSKCWTDFDKNGIRYPFINFKMVGSFVNVSQFPIRDDLLEGNCTRYPDVTIFFSLDVYGNIFVDKELPIFPEETEFDKFCLFFLALMKNTPRTLRRFSYLRTKKLGI